MLHFCDGFDSYTDINDLLHSKWDANLFDVGDWAWNAVEGVNGGGCLKHVGAGVGDIIGLRYFIWVNGGGRADPRTLFWFKIAAPPAEQSKLCQWSNNFGLFVNPNGSFEFKGAIAQGFSTPAQNPIFYRSPFSVCDNEWHCMEMAANFYIGNYLNPLIPTFRVALDDFVLFDDEVELFSSLHSDGNFYFYSLGVDTWIDDLIIWDEVGDNPQLMSWGEMIDLRADEFIWDWYNEETVNSDLNNFPERGQDDFFYWMGARQITTLRPTSDGTINDFDLVGAPTKLDVVDDAVPEISKYLENNQPGARMLFNFEDFQFDIPVYSIVVNSRHVMADFGSIVAHAEALVAPDFDVGVRRRISGNYKFVPDIWSANLVLNSGGPFVSTDDWNLVEGALELLPDGQLKLSNLVVGEDVQRGRVTTPITVAPGEYYYVRLRRGAALENGYHLYLRVFRNADGTESISWRPHYSSYNELITPDTTRLLRFRVPEDLTTVHISVSTGSAGSVTSAHQYDTAFYAVDVFPELHKWDFRHYQWAFRHNPATDVEWDQAGINSAEFGMRISP